MDRVSRTKFLVVNATVVVVIAVMTATAVLALRTTTHQLDEARKIDQRLARIDMLRAQTRELGLSARRYILTGDQKEQQRVFAIVSEMKGERAALALRSSVAKGALLEADLEEYIAALTNAMSFEDKDPIGRISRFEDELVRIRSPLQMTFDEVVSGERKRRESLRSARLVTRIAQWGIGALGGLTCVLVIGVAATALRRERSRDTQHVTRSRNELLAAATELRAPLEAIIVDASSVRTQLDPSAYHPARRQLDAIARNASRVNAMLAELLDVTAIQTGATTIRREAFDAAHLVDQVVKAHRDDTQVRGVRLRYEAQLSVTVFADRERIRHVLDTLVQVATAMAQGSAELVLHVGAGTDEVRFAIIEGGQRLDDAPSGQELALHLCSRVVEAHGGRLGVQTSALGRTYWFTLPTEPTLLR